MRSDRIFLDLETRGKAKRQSGHDMFLTRAQLGDVASVRARTPEGRLLVRINGPWERTADEVRAVIDLGADLVMLPMFRTVSEVEQACEAAAGRAAVVPLFETMEAAEIARDVMSMDGVLEAYIGLNDLALSFGESYLFRALLDPRFERLCTDLRASDKPFGIGGIGRIGSGRVPARLLLGEYLRQGASRVILSRAFRDGADTLDAVRDAIDLEHEIDQVRVAVGRMMGRSPDTVLRETAELWSAIEAGHTG